MSSVVASGIRYTLYIDGECSYDGIAHAVPRIGDSLSIDGNKVRITEVTWETGEVLGEIACASWGFREDDIAQVNLYSQRIE